MPIFFVTGKDRQIRRTVKDETINGIISKGVSALNLTPDKEYDVVLEQDGEGIVMTDDEILVEMAEDLKKSVQDPTKALYLNLMLLEKGEPYPSVNNGFREQTPNVTSSPNNIQRAVIGDGVESSSHGQDTTLLNSPVSRSENKAIQAFPWSTIVPKDFKDSNCNSTRSKNVLLNNVALYMMDGIKDTTLTTAGRLAELIQTKYPKAFEKKIGKKWKDGLSYIKISIYDRVQYIKKDRNNQNNSNSSNSNKKTTKVQDNDDEKNEEDKDNDESNENNDKRKRKRSSRKDEDEPSWKRFKGLMDSQGTVAYEPPLCDGEDEESQQVKKEKLLQDIKEKKLKDSEIENLLTDTYPSQRTTINHRSKEDRSVSYILEHDWPHLAEKKYLIKHASMLFGKDLMAEWDEALEKKLSAITNYFQQEIRMKHGKGRCPDYINPMVKELEKTNEACDRLKSREPNLKCAFLLISHFFKEELPYILIDPADSFDVKSVDSKTPILVIKGLTIYDEMLTAEIVVEEETILRSNNFPDAMLIYFISFFVFNYSYRPKIFNFLQFIQAFVFEIFPTHRSSKNKVSRKVMTIIDKISQNFLLPG